MGEVIKFDRGCRGCVHLLQIDKNTFVCEARENLDDSSIYPIVNGKHTDGWNICEGEDYVCDYTKLKRMSRSS